MRIIYSTTLLILVQLCIAATSLLPSLGMADTFTVACDDYNDFQTCQGITEDLFLGLIQNLDSANDCKNELVAGATSCNTPGGLSCQLIGDPANPTGVTCSLAGTATLFELDCTTLSGTSASCNVTDNINLQSVKLQPSAIIGSLLTANQRLFANSLFNVCEDRFLTVSPNLQAECSRLIALLDADDPAAAGLIDAITPDAASAALDASQTVIRAQNRNIAQRMSELRRAAKKDQEQVSLNGLQFRSNGRLIDPASSHPDWYAELQSASGGAASADQQNTRLGVFINGMLDSGDKETTSAERGFDFSGSELTAGLDYRISDDKFAGLAFGYATNSTEINNNRGQLDNTAYNLILYGSLYPSANTYIDANIIIGGGRFEQQRNIKYSYADPLNPGTTIMIDQVADATYFSDQQSLGLSAGHEFVMGALSISPYGSLLMVRSGTELYREAVSDQNAPGAGFALQIDAQTYESTSLALGGQFTYAANFPWGVLVPQAKLELVKEFKDDINVVTGNFVGDPNKEKFRLPTDAPDTTYLSLGLGSSGILPGGSTFYAFYQTYLGYDGLSYNSLNLGLRWEIDG